MAYDGMTLEPPNTNTLREWGRKAALCINGILTGKQNNVGTVTLTANTTTTTVTIDAGRLSSTSVIILSPTTANAKAEGIPYITVNATNNQFTITHANNAQTDRTYGYVING